MMSVRPAPGVQKIKLDKKKYLCIYFLSSFLIIFAYYIKFNYTFKIKYKYRKTWWWRKVHYNYFHKRLFKEFYVQNKKLTSKQIKKYHLYQKIDDLITLRKINWIRILIWKLEK